MKFTLDQVRAPTQVLPEAPEEFSADEEALTSLKSMAPSLDKLQSAVKFSPEQVKAVPYDSPQRPIGSDIKERLEIARKNRKSMREAGTTPGRSGIDYIKDLAPYAPFVGGVAQGVESYQAYDAAKRLESGKPTPFDVETIVDYLSRKERQGEDAADDAWYEKVGDIVLRLPGFATELYTTGTAAGQIRKGLQKTAEKAAEKAVQKAAERAVGKTVRKVGDMAVNTALGTALNVPRVGGGALERMAPQLDSEGNAVGGESGPLAATTSYVDTFIEAFSEQLGGAALGKLAKKGLGLALGPKKAAAISKALSELKPVQATLAVRKRLAGWLANKTGEGTKQTMEFLSKAGNFHGALGEYLEERYGEGMRKAASLLGLDLYDPEQSVIGDVAGGVESLFQGDTKEASRRLGEALQQTIIEGVAFSIPGAIVNTAGMVKKKLGKAQEQTQEQPQEQINEVPNDVAEVRPEEVQWEEKEEVTPPLEDTTELTPEEVSKGENVGGLQESTPDVKWTDDASNLVTTNTLPMGRREEQEKRLETQAVQPETQIPPAEQEEAGYAPKKASGVKGFKTAQGSSYEYHQDGTTTRTKSLHPGHDRKDVGKKRKSEATFFVTPDAATEIGMWQTLSSQGKRVVIEGGKAVLISKNPKTGEYGVDGRFPIKESPEIGLHPLELWGREDGGWFKNSHPGSAVTEMEQEEAPDAEEVVEDEYVARTQELADRLREGKITQEQFDQEYADIVLEAQAADELERIRQEAESIAEGTDALKQRSMVYQADKKEEVAKANGLPKDSYYDLPYSEWEKIRDEHEARREELRQEPEPEPEPVQEEPVVEPKLESPPKKLGKDPNIGRTWDSEYGKQTITGIIPGPDPLYEVATEGKSEVRRYPTRRIDEIVKTDEYRLTPEYAEKLKKDEEARDKAKEAEQKEAERIAKEDAELGEFYGDRPKMEQGRQKKTLTTKLQYKGKLHTRKSLIDQIVEGGGVVEQGDEGRRLTTGKDTFLGEDKLTKTGMNYAEWKIGRRAKKQPAKEPPKETAEVKEAPKAEAPKEEERPAKEPVTRTTPEKGTPERDALDKESDQAQIAADDAYNRLFKLEQEERNAKYGSKKKEQLSKKVDKLREEYNELRGKQIEARDAWYQAQLEDAAESEEAFQSAAARLALKKDATKEEKDAVYQQGVETLRKLVPAAKRLELDGHDRLSIEDDKDAIEFAIGQASVNAHERPLMASEKELTESLRGQIRRARLARYQRVAQEKLDKAGASYVVNKITGAYDFESIDREVERALGEKKAQDKAEKILAEQEEKEIEAAKETAKKNAREAKPITEVKYRINNALYVDIGKDTDSVTDGKILIKREFIVPSQKSKIEERPDGQKRLRQDTVDKVFDKVVKESTADAVFIGAADGIQNEGHASGAKTLAFFATNDGKPLVVDAELVALMFRATEFDSVKIKPLENAVFYKEGKPVGVVWGLTYELSDIKKIFDIKEGLSRAEELKPAKKKLGKKPLGSPLASPVAKVEAEGKLEIPLSVETETKKRIDRVSVVKLAHSVLEAYGRDMAIRWGRIPKRLQAAGIFKPLAEVIRTANSFDLPTVAHELAHGLSKLVWADVTSKVWNRGMISPAAVKELRQLGRRLYKNRQPAAGYAAEGMAEYVRGWLGNREIANKTAPEFTKWWENDFLPMNKKGGAALKKLQSAYHTYSAQGSVGRGEQGIADPGSLVNRLKKGVQGLKRIFSYRGIHEEFAPLKEYEKAVSKVEGRELQADESAFKLAKAFRGTASSIVKDMVERGMIDYQLSPTGGEPLSELSKLVGSKDAHKFNVFLWAKRAKALWEDQNGARDPGLSLDDANKIISEFSSPQFERAAQLVYKWMDGVMEYAAQASPALREAVERIRANDPGSYVPLQREWEDFESVYRSSAKGSTTGGSIAKKLLGSGRRILNPMESLISRAEEIVQTAHDRVILETAIKMSEYGGGGRFVEEVPKDQVPHATDLGKAMEVIRKKLKDAGVEVRDQHGNPIDPEDFVGQSLVMFSPAKSYHGSEPIIPYWDQDTKTIKWYYLSKDLYESLQQGRGPVSNNQALRLVDLLLGAPMRQSAVLKRMGTTAYVPGFSILWNLARDTGSLFYNTASGTFIKPFIKLTKLVPMAFLDAATNGKISTKSLRALDRLGIKMAQSLTHQSSGTRRLGKKLFHSPVRKILSVGEWLSYIGNVLQFSDSAIRAAELELIAEKNGIDLNAPLDLHSRIMLTLSAKEISTDFSATGDVTRWFSPYIPFFRAAIQGPRSAIRAAVRDPVGYSERILTTAAMGLLLWWYYKDEEWYKNLTSLDRLMYTYLPVEVNGKKELARLPNEQSSGMIPALIIQGVDAIYRRDPKIAYQAVREVAKVVNPISLPPLLGEIRDQLVNEDSFFETPIVKPRLENRPIGQQYDEYTSELAKIFGGAGVSPVRVDHAIRGITGGLGLDIAKLMGQLLTGKKKDETREPEPSDWPVIGRVFVRGGQEIENPVVIKDFYGMYEKSVEKQNDVIDKERPEERVSRLILEDARKAISDLGAMREGTYFSGKRSELRRMSSEIAKAAMKQVHEKDQNRIPMAATRKAFEFLRMRQEGDIEKCTKTLRNLRESSERKAPKKRDNEIGPEFVERWQDWAQEKFSALGALQIIGDYIAKEQ